MAIEDFSLSAHWKILQNVELKCLSTSIKDHEMIDNACASLVPFFVFPFLCIWMHLS